jgi:hypothetical protein
MKNTLFLYRTVLLNNPLLQKEYMYYEESEAGVRKEQSEHRKYVQRRRN